MLSIISIKLNLSLLCLKRLRHKPLRETPYCYMCIALVLVEFSC